MVAQAFQGLADLMSVGFLIIGDRRANRRSTKKHPFGYGKELYFWTLMSAFIIFLITGGLSMYFGWKNLSNPDPILNIYLAYAVLIFGIATNGYAFRVSAKKILEGRHWSQVYKSFNATYHIAPKTTFVLDLMGTASAVIGLAALIFYQMTGNRQFDAIGAMIIGAVLSMLAVVLLVSIKDLITGRSAPAEMEKEIRNAALKHPAVEEILDLRTMIVGSENILVNIEVHIKAGLTTNTIERVIDEIKENIKREVKVARHIQVELETPSNELKKSLKHSSS